MSSRFSTRAALCWAAAHALSLWTSADAAGSKHPGENPALFPVRYEKPVIFWRLDFPRKMQLHSMS